PTVPFLDLRAQDHAVGAAVRAAIGEVLASQQFVLGPHVERFEAAMAAYCGVPHAIGVGSGTDALVLALAALGVGPGTAVLTTPFSFFATASAIVRLGARPLFADIDPRTFTLDPASAEAALAHAPLPVVGMLPVHLFGRLAAMDRLGALAARHGLWIVEDAAQAGGARRRSARGRLGARGMPLVLPHEEPGRARRRRHGAHRRLRARRARPPRPPPRAGEPVRARRHRALLAARRAPSRGARGEAPPSRALERPATRGGGALRRGVRRRRARGHAGRAARAPRARGRGARLSSVRRARPGA